MTAVSAQVPAGLDLFQEIERLKKEKNAVIEYTHLDKVAVNPLQFRQLFQNLIANALKFSKEAVPPHIVIKSEIAPGSQEASRRL